MSQTSCFLYHLGNPNLSNSNLGLSISKQGLKIDEEYLPCCHGSGSFFDQKRNGIRRCSLKTRLLATEKIVAIYNQRWSEKLRSLTLPPALHHNALSNTAQILKGNAPQAKIMSGEKGVPGIPWSIALALVWRFNQTVHLISFENNKLLEYRFNEAHASATVCLIIEQVENLHDKNTRCDIESLIGVAYQTNSFLWIEFTSSKSAPASTYMAKKYQFRQRLDQMRNQHYSKSISPDCLSKLNSLSEWPRSNLPQDHMPD